VGGSRRSALSDHPSVRAWLQLRPDWTGPCTVESFGDERSRKREREIFRLVFPQAEEAASVVAKHVSSETALAESSAYELLHELSVPSLRFYGCVRDGDGHSWLFLEDAQGEAFDRRSDTHREAAFDWVAMMHVETARSRQRRLRLRDVRYYRDLCTTSIRQLLSPGSEQPFGREDDRTRTGLAALLQELLERWPQLRAPCLSVPESLTHNALLVRNLRVRRRADALEFLAFDWEHSGWGSPAVDVNNLMFWNPDEGAREYWRRVHSAWPTVTAADITKLALSGSIFRWIQQVAWEAPYIGASWHERPLATLEGYRQGLEGSVAKLRAQAR
jgi:hypothetical protein